MTFSDEQLDQIYETDLHDRFPKDLTPLELYFLECTDAHDLNTCNRCNVIKNTWDSYEFNWNCDHDLKGYDALCTDCYFELDCKPIEEN